LNSPYRDWKSDLSIPTDESVGYYEASLPGCDVSTPRLNTGMQLVHDLMGLDILMFHSIHYVHATVLEWFAVE
jgi:hypothetical protein